MKKQINPRPFILAAFILAAGMFRLANSGGLFPAFLNLTPLGAMAMFGGCYYQDKWKAYLVPLLTLWFTDIIINRFFIFNEWVFFYDGFVWVYSSFALMVLIGQYIKKVSIKSVVLSSLACALVHWLVSDIGVWLGGVNISTGQPFTRDLKGLMDCYHHALPYLQKVLIGNLVFGAILFGGFEFMHVKFPFLKLHLNE